MQRKKILLFVLTLTISISIVTLMYQSFYFELDMVEQELLDIEPLIYTPKAATIVKWKALCDAYPTYASYLVVGKTFRNNDIWLFKIGRNGGGKILFDSTIHGGEDTALELMYDFCAWVLSANDSLSESIRNSNQFWCIPLVNYDVNTRWNANNTGGQQGVNLNRNFYNGWTLASSNKSDGNNYRGCKPLSENESKALSSVFSTCGATFYVSGHHYDYKIYYESAMNSSIRTSIRTRCDQLCDSIGASKYPWYSLGVFGQSPNDAQRIFHITSFLYEVVTIPESTIQAMKAAHYPSFKCFMQTLAEFSGVPPIIPEYEVSMILIVMLLTTLVVAFLRNRI